jgi:hypothetical protein
VYYCFSPVYFIHQRVFGGQRHNYDKVPAYTWE